MFVFFCFFFQDSCRHQILFRYLSKTKGACCPLLAEWDSKHRYKDIFIIRLAENQRLSAALSSPFSAAFLLSFPPQRDKSAEVGSGGGMTTVPTVTSHPEEPSDLEELEQFARTFKQRRIKLGFTQVGRDTYCTNALVAFALDVLRSALVFFFLNLYSSTRET